MGSEKWKQWLSGLRTGEKLPKKNQLLLILLAGILLLVIVFPVPEQSGNSPDQQTEDTEPALSSDIRDNGDYEKYLEEKTARVLEDVEGVGEVTVMITLKSDGQKIIEKDQSSSSQSTDEEDSSGGTRSVKDQSSDKTSIYEQTADGSSTPYVSKELAPEVEGVVVIADGGDNAVVAQNITEAVQALFGVEAHKIKIMKTGLIHRRRIIRVKRLFKKNQIIIATLAVMIAVAGYLNYSGKLFGESADSSAEANADLANQDLLDISQEDIETGTEGHRKQ